MKPNSKTSSEQESSSNSFQYPDPAEQERLDRAKRIKELEKQIQETDPEDYNKKLKLVSELQAILNIMV